MIAWCCAGFAHQSESTAGKRKPTNPPTPTYLRYMSGMSGSQQGRRDGLPHRSCPLSGPLPIDTTDTIGFVAVGGLAAEVADMSDTIGFVGVGGFI